MKMQLRLSTHCFLPSALLLAALSPAGISAQTPAAPTAPATKPTPKVVHKAVAPHTAASAPAIKLPANIPVVHGIPKTLVQIVLKYIDIKPGTGAPAKEGWKYSVHYTGWLYNGTKFDSSVDRGTPIEFIQGAHRVIPGWDQGFAGMKVGGKRRLFIPYQMAYGERGSGPIPPKSDLIFDIELVGQTDPNAPPPPPAPAPATPQSAAPTSATPPPAGTPPPAAKPSSPQ